MYGTYKVIYGNRLQYSACFSYDGYEAKTNCYNLAEAFYDGLRMSKRFLHTSTDTICEEE